MRFVTHEQAKQLIGEICQANATVNLLIAHTTSEVVPPTQENLNSEDPPQEPKYLNCNCG